MARTADPNAREALLRAARAEFARHGLDRARVEDIAKAAGVSKGAFYLHFDSKEDVLRELVQRLVGVLEEMTVRRAEQEKQFIREHGELPRDPAAAHAYLAALTEFECAVDSELLETFWRHREVLAAVNGAAGEVWGGIVDEFRKRLRSQLAGEFATKERLGRLRPELDRDALVDVVTGAWEVLIVRLPGLRRKPDFQAWARTVTTVLLQGVLPLQQPARLQRRRS